MSAIIINNKTTISSNFKILFIIIDIPHSLKCIIKIPNVKMTLLNTKAIIFQNA